MVWDAGVDNPETGIGLIDGEKLTDMADAIRGLTGESSLLTADEMAVEIANLPGGVDNINVQTYQNTRSMYRNDYIEIDITNFPRPFYIWWFSGNRLIEVQQNVNKFVPYNQISLAAESAVSNYTPSNNIKFTFKLVDGNTFIRATNTGSASVDANVCYFKIIVGGNLL